MFLPTLQQSAKPVHRHLAETTKDYQYRLTTYAHTQDQAHAQRQSMQQYLHSPEQMQ
jgi:hypothetical protein